MGGGKRSQPPRTIERHESGDGLPDPPAPRVSADADEERKERHDAKA